MLGVAPALPSSGFPGGSDGKESTCNARDLGLILGQGAKIPTCLLAKKPKYKTEAML